MKIFLHMWLHLSHYFLGIDSYEKGVHIFILTHMPGFPSRRFNRSCSRQLYANTSDTIDFNLKLFPAVVIIYIHFFDDYSVLSIFSCI